MLFRSAQAMEFIDSKPERFDEIIAQGGNNVSGGQKQRISIARALIRNPKVIILDEATSALDNKSEIHVQKAMKNLMKNRTTFMVAHRLSTIKDAQKIVLINGGNIREQGTYEELISKKGEFYNLASNKDDGSK